MPRVAVHPAFGFDQVTPVSDLADNPGKPRQDTREPRSMLLPRPFPPSHRSLRDE